MPALFLGLLRAGSRDDLLRLVADAALAEAGADGVAIVEVLADGNGRVVEQRSAPALDGWQGEIDTVDAELGARLLAAAGGDFAGVDTIPMASDGDLHGALVLLFFAESVALREKAWTMAHALAELAAIELHKEQQLAALRRSNAELRASRAVLERTEKLRALGEMAAGISHDLKNILNPLSLHLQLLRRMLKGGAPGAVEAVAEMEQVLRRGVETVERLRAFSRQAPDGRIEAVDLDAVAREAIALSHPRIASTRRTAGVRLVAELGAPPPIQGRSSELLTAILNLIVNAIDAMPEGGTITVTSGALDGGAWVRVADDGPGIPDEIRARVFEPFFTTKGTEGTGLGLALVYALAQRYGGTVTLDTAPRRGTSFMLWFPTKLG
jgi:signal transduction histidine kinase